MAVAGPRENIWVGIRVRPLLEAEASLQDELCWRTSDAGLLQLINPLNAGSVYSFDQVFATSATADEVYYSAAKQRVLSALQVRSYC